MRKYRSPSLPWVIVFASAAMTLASTTARSRIVSPRPLPARSSPAGDEPECGPSCPERASPDPAVPGRRELWLRAAGPADLARAAERG